MTTLAVDASVSVKWFVPEEHEEQAVRLRDGPHTHIAPGHWRAEVMNALWKKLVVKREITQDEFARAVTLALAAPILLVPAEDLLESAVGIAVRYSRTVYDSLYIALAVREACPFVTADLRLYNALAPGLPDTMVWIGDVAARLG